MFVVLRSAAVAAAAGDGDELTFRNSAHQTLRWQMVLRQSRGASAMHAAFGPRLGSLSTGHAIQLHKGIWQASGMSHFARLAGS